VPQRKPRIERGTHLAWIRTLPCLICGTDQDIEAAHIRYPSLLAGKPLTGVGTKPHDCWTVPLCRHHHTWGPDAQHNARCSERDWWEQRGIDPIYAAALFWLHHSNDDWEGAMHVINGLTRLVP
jgi:hypothetical protein